MVVRARPSDLVDLCSGFGYMGMFLAEMLDPAKVQNVILVDKQWPMFNQSQPLPHQINWDHIYGVGDWKPTWPIRLFTRKSNIKAIFWLTDSRHHHVFLAFTRPFLSFSYRSSPLCKSRPHFKRVLDEQSSDTDSKCFLNNTK